MNPHGTPGQTPERKALEEAEVRAGLGAAVAAAMRVGLTREQVNWHLKEIFSELQALQNQAAAEAGRHAVKRRGPRRQKGVQ